MTTSADQAEFVSIVRRHLKLLDPGADLPMDANLEALGLDSAAALNLMLDVEDKFGVVFDESLFTEDTFASANSLWQALAKLRNG